MPVLVGVVNLSLSSLFELALAAAAVPEINIDDAVARLVGHGVGSDDAQALWQEIRDASRVDDIVAAFERRAQENPNSADAQAELGNAYIQQIMETDNYMEQGMVAMKASICSERRCTDCLTRS